MKQNKEVKKAMYLYEKYYTECQEGITQLLEYYQKGNQKIALWGGGLKGVAFLEIFDPNMQKVSFVYDNNEKKWGSKLPTGHQIKCLENSSNDVVNAVLLMNNNYETEVAGQLIAAEKKVALINVDSVILGELALEEILDMYGKEIGE